MSSRLLASDRPFGPIGCLSSADGDNRQRGRTHPSVFALNCTPLEALAPDADDAVRRW